MYKKYHTDAIVIRGYERGEADRVFGLFTKEFGFVWARCSAVRKEQSRMRYALQSGMRSDVSLIRGSRGWRLAGARAYEGFTSDHIDASAVFARITNLLERLMGGEEKNEFLFDTLVSAHAALKRESKERHALVELIAVARILHALGYLSREALGIALETDAPFSASSLHDTEGRRSDVLRAINTALAASNI